MHMCLYVSVQLCKHKEETEMMQDMLLIQTNLGRWDGKEEGEERGQGQNWAGEKMALKIPCLRNYVYTVISSYMYVAVQFLRHV